MTTAAVQHKAYAALLDHTTQTNLLGSTGSILGWDQEVKMPPKGLAHRTRQLAQLAKLTHQMKTDAQVGEWLTECEGDAALSADPLSAEAVNIRELRRDYDKATKLPEALVVEMAETTSQAKHEWAEARKENNFSRFKPWLEKVVELNQRKAECFGWDKANGGP